MPTCPPCRGGTAIAKRIDMMNHPNRPNHRHESIRKLAALIRDIDVAMITTEDENGELRSRPMATQKPAFDGTLWFLTRSSSPKVNEVKTHSRVNICFSDRKERKFVSV